jgi:hypothetical protein
MEGCNSLGPLIARLHLVKSTLQAALAGYSQQESVSETEDMTSLFSPLLPSCNDATR